MRVNAIALMRAGGVSCLFEEAPGQTIPARIALVTEETVRAARSLAGEDPSLQAGDGSPQVRYGGALAYVGSGTSRRLILQPGEGDPFMLPGRTRFMGRNMLDAERHLSGSRASQGETGLLLSCLRSILRMVATVPDEDRFPPYLIVQGCLFSLREAFGDARLPLREDALILKSRADLLRARIAALDPRSPDALGASTPLPRLLDRSGLEARSDGVRVPGMGLLTRSDLRHILEEGALRDGLFKKITRTPPERIDAVALSTKEAARLDRSLEPSRLSGLWVDAVRDLGADLTGSGINGYRLDLTFYGVDGRDLMMMSDTVGQETGVSILFSWPSGERVPTIETPEGPVYAICPEEVPKRDEVIRLERVLAELLSRKIAPMAPQDALDA
jgi:hypothetical protein